MNLGGRRQRKNSLNPNVIFYQDEVQPVLKKEPKSLKIVLVQLHCTILFHSAGIPHVTHIFGPKP